MIQRVVRWLPRRPLPLGEGTGDRDDPFTGLVQERHGPRLPVGGAIVADDVSDFPPRPLVCFLYNPFGEVVLDQVIDNIGRSLSEHPRDLFVVYLHPMHDRLLRDRSFLTNLRRRDWVSIYRSRFEGSVPVPAPPV